VLLVDDNPEFLDVAGEFLCRQLGIEIVGVAHSGRQALEMVHDLEPDVVLMDLSMPEMNGLEATRRIKALSGPPAVVILTLFDTSEIQSFSHAAGADAFLTKSDFVDSLPPLLVRLFPQLKLEPVLSAPGT
jgi:DNA-binding NarL/FixJ family response regulator